MKAFLPNRSGSVDLAGVPEPSAASQQAVVAVEAYSINRGETFLLEHPRPGHRPGKDVAGRVVRPARDGSGPPAGTRVVGHPPAGGWAERVAVNAQELAVLPANVPITVAAALPLAGLTAVRLLRRAGTLLGRRLLMTGASGGVGHYVTELAVAAGAEITTVSASPERGAGLARLGAQVITDLDDVTGPYDVVLESVGGATLAAARRQARPDGLVIWFGQTSRQPATLDFFDWVDGTTAAPIASFDYTRSDRPIADDLATLVQLVHTGRLHPEIGTQLPWEHTADVIAELRARRVRGNAVLTLR